MCVMLMIQPLKDLSQIQNWNWEYRPPGHMETSDIYTSLHGLPSLYKQNAQISIMK